MNLQFTNNAKWGKLSIEKSYIERVSINFSALVKYIE